MNDDTQSSEGQTSELPHDAETAIHNGFKRLKDTFEAKSKALANDVEQKLAYSVHNFHLMAELHHLLDEARNGLSYLQDPEAPGASVELTIGQLMAQDWHGNLSRIGASSTLTVLTVAAGTSPIQTAWMQDSNPARHLQLIMMDGTYWLPTVEDMHKIAESTRTADLHYIKERFDCDDFAGLFRGLCSVFYGVNSVGYVVDYSGRHSYNIAACTAANGGVEFRVIEPQSDRFVAHSMEHKAPYNMEQGFVLM